MLRLQSERCRLCGIHNYDLKSVEDNLAARIKILFHLQIKMNCEKDKLSKCVCNNCVLSVSSCWKFYLLIHKVQHELTRENYIKEEPLTDEDVSSTDENYEDFSLTKDDAKLLDNNEMNKIKESVNFVTKDLSQICNDQVDAVNNIKVEVLDKFKGGTEELPRLFSNNQEAKATNKNIRPRKRLKIKRNSKICHSNSTINRKSKTILDKDEIWMEYPWWCLKCRSNFDTPEAFNQHLCFTKHHRYYCADCSKGFVRYNYLIMHVKQFHWERLRTHTLCQCDLCNCSFHSIAGQVVHRIQMHPDAEERAEPEMPQYFSLTCQVCNKTFANRGSLKKHAIMHSDELSHVCDTCGRAFRYAIRLKEHVIRHHTTDADKLHCDQCGKMFAAKGSLNTHMIIHSKERPYTCDICHKSFKQEYYLKYHKTKHSIEKPYVCEICDKDFNCKGYLRNHIRNHTLERRHKCSYCEKAFKRKVHQLNHERQHTGEQPYSCTVCDKKFTSYGNRIKHMNRIHDLDITKKDKNDMEQE